MAFNLPDLLGGLLADSIPGGFVLSEAVKSYLQRRADAARDILVEELRSGAISPEHIAANDDLVGIIFRYGRAAYEGAARLNLRLLAKAIRGQIHGGKLIADEFFRYADVLASLSRDEIVFLGALYRVGLGEHADAFRSLDKSEWAVIVADMTTAGWNESAVYPVALRCLRTGYVIAIPAVGTLNFSASPLLMELGKTVDFDDALKRECA